MRPRPRRLGVVVFAAMAIGAGVLLGFAGWPQPHRTLEFSGLILAAILISALATQPSTDAGLGHDAAVLRRSTSRRCCSSVRTRRCSSQPPGRSRKGSRIQRTPHPLRRMLLNAATVLVATQAAGLAHRALGGTMGQFTWPGQGVPIAAAVVAYCFVRSALAESHRAARHETAGQSIVAEELSPGLSELLHRRQPRGGTRRGDRSPECGKSCRWRPCRCISPTARTAAHVSRLEEEHRRREVIESLDQGMSVVDSNGQVTLWNDALERILGCPRERALGRSLVSAVPALGKTELPRAINEALTTRSPRTLARLGLPVRRGCADSAGQDSPRCRWRDAALA